ncbi:MAG: tRNA (N(6)-L-threonylcarbamoyladenosine(37)-C(2))-methylthiotransferase [Candidatus Woesearchaeota archaeon]
MNNKVYVKTFGCSLNQSDSEVMSGLLKEAGYDVVSVYSGDVNLNVRPKNVADIDAVIINTCTVKGHAESKFFRELRFWNDHDVKVIVTGCIPQAEPGLLDDRLKDISVIGTRQIIHIVDVLRESLSGKVIHNIDNDMNERLNLPKVRKNSIIEIIPISEGCMSVCTYCKTKFARGELSSYPKEKIIAQFKEALHDGCKEFWITSQDNGCYGFDIYRKEKYFLPQLLNDLLSIDGNFRIRLGMCNPDHIDRIKEDLVQVYMHPKMFKFLHMPVQSGSDAVLRNMKRSYTMNDFKRLIILFRKEIPDITISTDMIVGFPGETDAEFNDSMNLIKEINFDVLNLSRFWSRPGTAAANMKQVKGDISKSRSIAMKSLFDGMSEKNNKRWSGSEFIVLIDEHGKNGSLIGRDDTYKQVIIKDPYNIKLIKLGDFVKVRIVATKIYTLLGEIIVRT